MKRIVCIGDSLTYGYGVEREAAWPAIASKKMNVEIINKGENGDYTAGMSARFRSDVLELEPDVVVITGGSNDILESVPINDIIANMQEMSERALAAEIQVVVGIPMYIDVKTMVEEGIPAAIVRRCVDTFLNYRMELLKYCKEMNISWIDFQMEYPKRMELLEDDEPFIDGVHPTEKGYRVMAEIFCDAFGNHK